MYANKYDLILLMSDLIKDVISGIRKIEDGYKIAQIVKIQGAIMELSSFDLTKYLSNNTITSITDNITKNKEIMREK